MYRLKGGRERQAERETERERERERTGKKLYFQKHLSVQFSSVTQWCQTLCDPMNHSTPGLPVHHHLPEFTQTHVHRVSDAFQPSHPLSSPFPPAPNPSQHQSLFQLKYFKYGASVCKYYSKIISKTTYVTTFLNCM